MVYKVKSKDLVFIADFLQHNRDDTFYYTENNQRTFVRDLQSLNIFLRNVSIAYYTTDELRDISGVISVWKSVGNDLIRFYVKINCKDYSSAKKLIKNLIWNCNKELYCKINKKHRYLSIFFDSGFKFVGNRGTEFLLCRKKTEFRPPKELSNGDNSK